MGRWNKIKLGNACLISKGQQLNKVDLEKAGDYPCINGGIEPSGYTDKWNTEANTITISEGGNSCGYVNFNRTRFWSGGHCYSLLELKDSIDVNFLYHALKGRESLIMGLRVGSGLPNIQQKALKEFEFDYPESKSEQTRIAQILSTADRAIAQTEALIAKYQRIKTGLMQDLLTRGIDEHGRIRSKATHRFVVKKGIEVPEEWEVLTMEDLCSKITDGSHFSPIPQQEGQLIGNVKDMGEYEINIASCTKITQKDFEILKQQNCSPNKGDVLLSKDGTIGRVIFYNTDFEIVLLSSIAILRPKPKYNGLLLSWYLKSEFFKKQLLELESGSALRRIVLKDIRKLKFPFPKEPKEQEILANKLLKISSLIQKENIKLTKLQSLKTGLMQDLLSGRVRVKVPETGHEKEQQNA
ncbi:MAG: restriction endonuclease subunit S [Bacteroidota bacterium]